MSGVPRTPAVHFSVQRQWQATAALLLLPFLLFFWLMPYVSHMAMGRDYLGYPLPQHMEFSFAFRSGTFPLFIPGFVGGQTWTALTLGQPLHPMRLASFLPGYWRGHAVDAVTLLRLLSLGAAHLFLYRLLRGLRISAATAFTLSLVTVYNLRALDMFRYGAGLEAWTGHIFLCASLGHVWLFPERRRWDAAVVASSYWTAVSGHPQMAYFAFLGGALFALLFPSFARLVADVPLRSRTAFWGRAAALIGIGVMLAAAFIIPFVFEFMRTNGERVGTPYAWSLEFQDPLAGALYNFTAPLRSGVHGAFGASALYLPAALAPLAQDWRRERPWPVTVISFLAAVIFLNSLGNATPVHHALWRVIPFSSDFRVPGRLTLLLPMLFLLQLTWLFRTKWAPLVATRFGFADLVLLISFLATASMLVIPLNAFPRGFDTPDVLSYDAAPFDHVVIWLQLGAIVLVAAMQFRPAARAAGIALAVVSVLELMVLFRWGNFRDPKPETPTFAQMRDSHTRLRYLPPAGQGMKNRDATYADRKGLSTGLPLARLYAGWIPAGSRRDADARLAATDRSVIIERPDAPPANARLSGKLDLAYAAYNRLVFDVTGAGPGSVLFVRQPLMSHWRATVNGRAAPVFRADATYLAVDVPAGDCRVDLRFHSTATLIGFSVSAATLAALGAWLLAKGFRPFLRAAGVAVIVAAAVGFAVWRHSLYSGRDRAVVYSWPPRVNDVRSEE